jgi:predicted phosphodiesterase
MCHIGGIEYSVDYIASKNNCYFIHLGDWIEAIMTDDKRYNAPPDGSKEKEQSIPVRQARDAVRIFKPIRRKIIAGLKGNHERKLQRFGNLVEDNICGKKEEGGLDIPYGTESCRIILENNNKPMFNIFAMHGRKIFNSRAKDYEQNLANRQASMKLTLVNQMGDCLVMLCGHAHQILIVPPAKKLYFTDDEKGVQQRYLENAEGSRYINPDQRWYACCGSARKSRLDGYDDYAQVYDPVELGFVKITVEGGRPVNIEPFLI